MLRLRLAIVSLGAHVWCPTSLQQLEPLKREWLSHAIPSEPPGGLGWRRAATLPRDEWLERVRGASLSAEQLSRNAAELSESLAALGSAFTQQGGLDSLDGTLLPSLEGQPWATPSPLVLVEAPTFPASAPTLPAFSSVDLNGLNSDAVQSHLAWGGAVQSAPALASAPALPAFAVDQNALNSEAVQPTLAWGGAVQPPPQQWQQLAQPQSPLAGTAQTASQTASLMQLARGVQAPPQASDSGDISDETHKPIEHSTDNCSPDGSDEDKLDCGPLSWFFSLGYNMNQLWMIVLFWLCSCCVFMPVTAYICFYNCVQFA